MVGTHHRVVNDSLPVAIVGAVGRGQRPRPTEVKVSTVIGRGYNVKTEACYGAPRS